jgi:hypothetical protein
MPRFCRFVASVTLSSAAVLALGALDVQAAKMSYEQAFAQCKEEIKANVSGNESTQHSGRYAAGMACMKRYGYRLKKKSKF